MDAPQKAKFIRIEGLHPHAQAIDAQAVQRLEAALIDRAGIGFAADFGVRGELKTGIDSAKNLLQVTICQHGGRAAAQEQRGDRRASPG